MGTSGESHYRVIGDSQGSPLMALHGGADCSLIWGLLDQAAKQTGVRLIAVDRPGFGDRTYAPGRDALAHGSDLCTIADELAIGAFPVIAISGGLVHALGAAWSYPDRVNRLTSYSGMYLGAPGYEENMSAAQRATVRLGLRSPRALEALGYALFGPQVALAKRRPQAIVKLLRASRPAGDQKILDRPEVAALMAKVSVGALRSVAAVNEGLGVQQLPPYPFRLHEIKQPVEIWQGGQDTVHTPAMGRHLAAELPNSTMHFQPDLATFDMVDLYPQMLARAVGSG